MSRKLRVARRDYSSNGATWGVIALFLKHCSSDEYASAEVFFACLLLVCNSKVRILVYKYMCYSLLPRKKKKTESNRLSHDRFKAPIRRKRDGVPGNLLGMTLRALPLESTYSQEFAGSRLYVHLLPS